MSKPKMILVVDDDPNLVMFFKDFFKQEGYNSLCTDDPEKAVRMSNLVHPDLLMIDIRMPRIDGFGVLERVRENTPEIKTIIVSAYVEGVQDKIAKAKVQAVLKKPVQFDELEKWILKLLDVTKEEVQAKIAAGEAKPQMRILFVDDEQEILDAVAEAVNGYGFMMETAKSGEEGLEKAKEKAYDVIIADNSMRNMSGYDMIRKIRLESKFKPYVYAISSANLTRELEEKYRGLGVEHFLPKPIRLEDIIKWLESHIPAITKGRTV